LPRDIKVGVEKVTTDRDPKYPVQRGRKHFFPEVFIPIMQNSTRVKSCHHKDKERRENSQTKPRHHIFGEGRPGRYQKQQLGGVNI